MYVRDGMSTMVLTVGPGHTLRQAARQMVDKRVGAAVVVDPEAQGPSIITERDVLRSIGRGEDPDAEKVADHLTGDIVVAGPDWSLEQAATEMVKRGFRHLVVVDGGGSVSPAQASVMVARPWRSDFTSGPFSTSPASTVCLIV